jgi:hypothetical protein
VRRYQCHFQPFDLECDEFARAFSHKHLSTGMFPRVVLSEAFGFELLRDLEEDPAPRCCSAIVLQNAFPATIRDQKQR